MERVVVLVVLLFVMAFSRTVQVSGEDPGEWTIMIYMDADNDLEYSAIADFSKLAQVGSSAAVNVVVQLDRVEGYSEAYGNWTDCKRFHITLGMTPSPENAIVSLGEVNMGDPETLKDFMMWSLAQYSAEKYALILWNHGWLTVICTDSSHDWDMLTSSEIHATLNEVLVLTGTQLDVIGFAACFCGSTEMAYEVSEGAKIMCASEEVVSSLRGYPYNTILSQLVASPTMNATAFAMLLHNQFVAFNQGFGLEIHTHSVFNTTKVANELAPEVSNLAYRLDSILPTHIYEILDAIDDAATGETATTWRDLYDFCQILAATISDVETADIAQSVMDALIDACIAEWHDINSYDLHGLSIYLPSSMDEYVDTYASEAIEWRSDTVWDDFVDALFLSYYPGTLSQESLSEISYMLLDSNADDYLDTIHVRVDADTTGASSSVSLLGQLINSNGSIVDTDSASWTILGSDEEWADLYLSIPQGGAEDWYDVELFLYDGYGILEDHHYSVNNTRLPQVMQHDITVMELSVNRDIVGQGYSTQINVTICNTGHYMEEVNVTTSANGTLLDTRQLNLTSGEETSITIAWVTISESLGNYTISSIVEPVEGEVYIDDNALVAGPVLITIPGDVDGDYDVDIFDIVTMAGDYGSNEGDPEFDPISDINGNGAIDIFDIVIAAGNYGESFP
jgi:hypothetical protein